MKRDWVRLALGAMALVVSCAAEELFPKTLGVGFPALLAATAYFAARRPAAEAVLFALVAGASEDSLSSLPFATSAAFFAAAALLLGRSRLPIAFAPVAYAAYQLWLWMWMGSSLDGSVFARVLAALPVGAAAAAAAVCVLSWADGKGAVDEA